MAVKFTLNSLKGSPGIVDLPKGPVEDAVTGTTEQFSAYNLFDQEAQQQIRDDAVVDYDKITDAESPSTAIVTFGEEDVQELNELNKQLLDEMSLVDFEHVNQITRELIAHMAKLEKWDPRQEKIAEQLRTIGETTRKLFERAKSPYAASLLNAARGERAMLEELVAKIRSERHRINRNVASLEAMYQSTNEEYVQLAYRVAVLEQIRVLAVRDMEEKSLSESKITLGTNDHSAVGELSAFIKLIDLKLDGLRSRLTNSTSSGPRIRGMRLSMLGTAAGLWNLEQLAVPAMEGTIVQWIIQAQTLESGHIQQTTAELVQRWALAGAEASAINIPEALKSAFTPIMPAEVIARIQELDQQQQQGTLDVFKESAIEYENASRALRNLQLAEEAAEQLRAEQVDPELVERVNRLSGR